MNWRSPRFLIPLLIVSVLLIIGIGVAIVYLRGNTSANITIIWQAHSTVFTQQDQQDIQTALKSSLLASNLGNVAGNEFTIIDAQRQGDWAIFSASERVSHNTQPIPTEPLFFLAHQQGTRWTIWLPGSTDFCDQLKQVPGTLLNAIDKGYFC